MNAIPISDRVNIDLVTVAILSTQHPTPFVMIIEPRPLLAKAELTDCEKKDYLRVDQEIWKQKAHKFVVCPEKYFATTFKLYLPIPESIEIPTSVVSGSATTGVVLRKLKDISWVAFLALLVQKPNKGDGLKFEPHGKSNFLRVGGKYFKVIDTQTRSQWMVVEVDLDNTSQCPVNALLFNPMTA